MVEDQCLSELAKLFELLPSITPSYVIAKGWKEHVQNFFRQGTEEDYFKFKPDSFRSDPLPSPTSTPASPPASPPVRRPRSSSVTSPPDIPSSSVHTSTTLHGDKSLVSDTITFIPWQEHNSPPRKKPKAPSTVDKAVDSLEPVANFDTLCATVWETTPTFSSRSGPSSRYEILGKAINGLSGRVHITGCHDRIFLLFVSHVVDEQEDDIRMAQDPGVYNPRSAAMERAAKLMSVEHRKVSEMIKTSNRYLHLLTNGPGFLFDIREGKKKLWERELHLKEIDEAGELARRRWENNRGKEFERNFLASKVIIDGLVLSGWTYSSLAAAKTRLIVRLKEWVDVEELERGKVQMRSIPMDNGENHHEDQQNGQRHVDLNAREVRSIDTIHMASGASPRIMPHARTSAQASNAGHQGGGPDQISVRSPSNLQPLPRAREGLRCTIQHMLDIPPTYLQRNSIRPKLSLNLDKAH
ncbi:hypothetical protein B0J12DRAFT_462224 [Macrophomina phaseolina]|uniref:Uncharacterized protein n=1 Tax=Macrophomina phaseolina TaxID=35725 RepID=A0ABQ8FQA8_9PEZI|nr:hypothetical protein B0J12DRAFT_462224 [Macrophomina phaseolina]